MEQAPSCKILELAKNGQEVDVSTPAAPTKRKRREPVPLVENEVRRSPRILELNEGFKNHSSCSYKSYLSCSVPPCCKIKIVKNLATSFCKVSKENLDSKLPKKGKKPGKEKEVWCLVLEPSRARRRNESSL
jgi:hypothetical protein